MRTPPRALAGLAAGCALAAVTTSAAHALWSARQQVAIPAITRGQVAFAAGASGADPVASVAGAPVTLTVPGSLIAEVLDEGTAVWAFTVSGATPGTTGLVYDVSVGQQVTDGDGFDVVDGVARPGTVLAASTLKIYPAGSGADCSDVPATPADGNPANVFVYDGTARVLHEPGSTPAGQTSEQAWCVAVAFDPSTGDLGEYRSTARVEALAQDATASRDDDEWHASLQPDPSDEPGLTIRLDPSITRPDPAVPPGEHASPVS